MSTSDLTPNDLGDSTAIPGEPEDDWDDVPIAPRSKMPWLTRLLLVGAVAALAFAGGVFANRQWGHSGSSGSGGNGSAAASFLSRLRANGGSSSAANLPGGFAGAGVTTGQIAYIRGSTLFVSDSSGNVVKVRLPKGLQVTKSVTTTAKALRPGDTVIVRGEQGSDGTVRASSLSVGSGSGAGLAP